MNMRGRKLLRISQHGVGGQCRNPKKGHIVAFIQGKSSDMTELLQNAVYGSGAVVQPEILCQ